MKMFETSVAGQQTHSVRAPERETRTNSERDKDPVLINMETVRLGIAEEPLLSLVSSHPLPRTLQQLHPHRWTDRQTDRQTDKVL